MLATDRLDLTGRRIVVTGACGALGTNIVRTLHAYGASVMANDLIEAGAARGLLPAGTPYFASATRTSSDANTLLDAARDAFGDEPNIVCCHAGLVGSHPIDEYPESELDDIFLTNFRSAFLLAKAAAHRWKEVGKAGQIIFTSSWVGSVPWPGGSAYGASKAAVNSVMRAFAREMAPFGIRSNAIAPGIVDAGMAKVQWNNDPEFRRRAERAIPLGRLQEPDSVSDAFLFLCSGLSDYMNGAILTVDGGASLYPMD